jgi:hypothetical protein
MKKQAGVIAVAVVVVAVVLVASHIGDKGEEETPTETVTPGGEVNIIQTEPAARIVLEAEAAAVDGAIEPPVQVREGVEGASGDACCYIGPEKVNETEEIRQYERGYPNAAAPGYARLAFTAPETGNYRVWLRVRWSDDCGDSLDVVVDGRFLGTVQGNADKDNPRWMWLPLGRAQAPITVHLEAGKEHALTLANREDDLWFDQILLVDAEAVVEPVGILEP